jgi:hypothetical protein
MMKTTSYFQEQVLRKRPYLSLEMCMKVVEAPLRKELQSDGRFRCWGFVTELDRYIRVVLLEDGETIHNAFMDRNFKL